MHASPNVRVVLGVFAAIEQRDLAGFLAHVHPECTIRWPPSLPWNDGLPGRPDEHGRHARSWLEVWEPLQPTAAERRPTRAQMFDFDPDAVTRFLEATERERRRSGPAGVRPPRR